MTTRETRSPYDALSIESNASANEIKRAFRALAKTKHPDVTADDGAAFRLVVSAYDVLSDDVLRLDLANGEIVRHGEFTWRLGDGDVAKTRATKWTYDDSETFVRWTKPRRARAPRVEGLTLAPSDRDERVRKWRLSQFVSLWCVVERTRDGFDLESSASARSSPERRFGSVRFVSFRFVSDLRSFRSFMVVAQDKVVSRVARCSHHRRSRGVRRRRSLSRVRARARRRFDARREVAASTAPRTSSVSLAIPLRFEW